MSIDIVTFGCRLNVAEGATIKAAAEAAGLSDTIIINSCAVTSEALAQVRQSIRRLRRDDVSKRIVVTGCGAQTEPAMFSGMAEVDALIGNADKADVDAWRAVAGWDTRREAGTAGSLPPCGGEVERGVATPAAHALTPLPNPPPQGGREQSARASNAVMLQKPIPDIMTTRARPSRTLPPIASHLPRAYLQVQTGCDHRCTFCIIPFGRGPSRSSDPADVVTDARALLDAGHPEIVLTGVDLTSYTHDGLTLGALAKRLLRELPDLTRLRISSIDAVEADSDLLDLVANEPRLMPHLHLSLQAGDDIILKRMKRRHSRADAIAFCAQLKRLRPNIALGADFIAGFPTETDAMAARTRDLIDDCDLTFLHVFPYSPRPTTPAARMPQVDGRVIRARAQALRESGVSALRRRLDAEIGQLREVLVESATQARTEHFIPMAWRGDRIGTVRHVRVTGRDGTRLMGEVM